MAKIQLPPEVLASIVTVSGEWALHMATTPNSSGTAPQPSEISQEIETDFDWAFKYLEAYLHDYYRVREESVL